METFRFRIVSLYLCKRPMHIHRTLTPAMLLFLIGTSAIAAEPKRESLLPAIDAKQHAVAGAWTKSDAGMTVAAAQGARLWLPYVRIRFTRKTGIH